MLPRCRAVALAFAGISTLLLAGCGSTPAGANVNPVSVVSPISGRWSFVPDLSLTSAGVPTLTNTVQFHGSLQTSGTTVTGSGIVLPLPLVSSAACLLQQTVTLTGTFSATRHLSLTSDGKSGSVLHLEVDVPADPHAASKGTASLTGQCNLPAAAESGSLYDAIAGTYTGAVQQLDPSTPALVTLAGSNETAVLTETAPDAEGKSMVSGTIKVALPACSTTLPVSATRYGGVLFTLNAVPSLAALNPRVNVSAAPDASNAVVNVLGLANDCKPQDLLATPQNTFVGKLLRQ